MKRNMKRLSLSVAVLCVFWAIFLAPFMASAQETAFSYQGQLQNNGSPVNGSYDLQFTLFSTNVSGAPVAGPVTNAAVTVSNGMFTTSVDLGDVFSGTKDWLEIAVSTNGANTFTVLAPREPIQPVPSAIFANAASNLSGSLPAAQLTGSLANAQLPADVLTNGNVNPVSLPTSVSANAITATNVTAATFIGDGSGLTNLPIANINGLGALAAASSVSSNNLSGQINAGQVFGAFTGSQLPANVLTNGNVSPVSLPTSVSANAISATNVTAATFVGDGSGLTNLPISNINGLGSLAAASSVSSNNLTGQINAGQVFGALTGSQLPTNVLTNGNVNPVSLPTSVSANAITATNVTAATFVGDGSGLTNLPISNINGLGALAAASSVSSNNLSGQINVGQLFGTLPNGQLPSNLLTNGYTNSISLPTHVAANAIAATNVTAATFIGDGTGLTNIQASNVKGLGSLATASTVSSNNLTGQINVGQLFGSIPDSRLPANVLTNGYTNSISLPTRLTANAVTATNVTAATLVGDGSGLTNLQTTSINGLGALATASSVSSNNISGQINVGQVYGALSSGSLPANILTNGYSNAISLPTSVSANAFKATNVTAATFIGDGSGLTNLPISNINGLGSLAAASSVSSNNISGQINVGQVYGALSSGSLPANILTNEIGRASCRERV